MEDERASGVNLRPYIIQVLKYDVPGFPRTFKVPAFINVNEKYTPSFGDAYSSKVFADFVSNVKKYGSKRIIDIFDQYDRGFTSRM